jgi:hypothetical protein
VCSQQDYPIQQIVVIAGLGAGLCSMLSRRPSWKNEASRMLGTRATNGRGERSPGHFKKRSPMPHHQGSKGGLLCL